MPVVIKEKSVTIELHQLVARNPKSTSASVKAGQVTASEYRVCATFDADNYVAYRVSPEAHVKFMIEGAKASLITGVYPSDTGTGSSLNIKGGISDVKLFDNQLQHLGFETDFSMLCDDAIRAMKNPPKNPIGFVSSLGKKEKVDDDGVITIDEYNDSVAVYEENELDGDEIVEIDDPESGEKLRFTKAQIAKMYYLLFDAKYYYEENYNHMPVWAEEMIELADEITKSS